jgi:glutaminyl-tRNA synthetase
MVTNEIAKELHKKESEFSAEQISELVKMLDDGTISNKIAKEVFNEILKSGDNPMQIVEAQGLKQINNEEEIIPIIDEIIAKNPDNVKKFKDGNTKLLGFFVGQVLKATGGKANPTMVNELVNEQLQE